MIKGLLQVPVDLGVRVRGSAAARPDRARQPGPRAASTMPARALTTPSGGRVWEDPSVYGINKRSPHVPLHAYATREAALEAVARIGRQTSSGQRGARLSLSGAWDFKLFDRPGDVPEGFSQADFSTADWAPVRTPPYRLARSRGRALSRVHTAATAPGSSPGQAVECHRSGAARADCGPWQLGDARLWRASLH